MTAEEMKIIKKVLLDYLSGDLADTILENIEAAIESER